MNSIYQKFAPDWISVALWPNYSRISLRLSDTALRFLCVPYWNTLKPLFDPMCPSLIPMPLFDPLRPLFDPLMPLFDPLILDHMARLCCLLYTW